MNKKPLPSSNDYLVSDDGVDLWSGRVQESHYVDAFFYLAGIHGHLLVIATLYSLFLDQSALQVDQLYSNVLR